MPKRIAPPKYTRHKASGQAVVRLNGRDFYLGPYGSQTSINQYDALIAEWLENGRRLPEDDEAAALAVNELVIAYVDHAERYYRKDGRPTSELYCIKAALRFILALYGYHEAADFRPLKLKACRRKMIEAGLSRSTCNSYVDKIRRMFKWAVGNELVDAVVYQSLLTVPGLQAGRTDARETERVKPVPWAAVKAVRPYVARPVWGMIELQHITGMRPGEVCIMRACDVDVTGNVWSYIPESHKTEHHGHDREILIGPKARRVLEPFLKRDRQAFLFSPRDAEAERLAELRAGRKTPVQPSQRDRRTRNPQRQPGERYTRDSYRRAVQRAIRKANEAIERENEQHGTELPPVPMWSPNRLRHNAATRVRRQAGLETAQVILGHTRADVTQVYAERDRDRAVAFVLQHG